jgi:F-type H+-transporting ATPase subunit gamma
MASGKEIKWRIKSVKNTGKITKAMELISTVKMKKAQDSAVHARPFAIQAANLFMEISEGMQSEVHNENKKELVLVIASNKWLCGGYNVNVFKTVASLVSENPQTTYHFVSAGKRARDFIARTGQTLISDFSDILKDTVDAKDAKQVSRMLQNEYKAQEYTSVRIIYSHFVSAISQKSLSKVLFPATKEDILSFLETIQPKRNLTEDTVQLKWDYEFEPSKEVLIEQVLPMIYDLMVLEAFLEAKASEHASRMVAMKNAKDSANKKVKSLTLTFNKARQAAITKEVSEIVSGVESMKE